MRHGLTSAPIRRPSKREAQGKADEHCQRTRITVDQEASNEDQNNETPVNVVVMFNSIIVSQHCIRGKSNGGRVFPSFKRMAGRDMQRMPICRVARTSERAFDEQTAWCIQQAGRRRIGRDIGMARRRAISMAKLYVAEERTPEVQRWLTRDWTRIKSGR